MAYSQPSKRLEMNVHDVEEKNRSMRRFKAQKRTRTVTCVQQVVFHGVTIPYVEIE